MKKGCNNTALAKKTFWVWMKNVFVKPQRTNLFIDGKKVIVELMMTRKEFETLTEEIIGGFGGSFK